MVWKRNRKFCHMLINWTVMKEMILYFAVTRNERLMSVSALQEMEGFAYL